LVARTQSSSPTRSSTFLPFFRPQSTRSLSPERVSVAEAAEYAVHTPSEGSIKKKRANGAADILANWFDGSSDPVNISLLPSPRKEKLDPLYEAGSMENMFSGSQEFDGNLTKRLPRRSSGLPSPIATNPSASRFSFFRRSTVSLSAQDVFEGDDLVHLDIHTALFPHGQPGSFSPATIKNLQLNAEGTIRRFQQAYTEQQKSLKIITSTKDVQDDELKAEQTRNEHLTLQLQEMAERAAEQDRAIANLTEQLAEQRTYVESHQAHQQSIRMVSQEGGCTIQPSPRSRFHRNRSSDVSMSGESDISDVSSIVSVFSEAPSSAPSHATSIHSPVLKTPPMAFQDCPKCHGLHSTEAWDVVSTIKMESTALKQRIAQLESAQDDALSYLSGLKLS
jgi:uncharacterized coiled-coil protein SlyX